MNLIGKGLAFPLVLNSKGGAELIGGKSLVEQSIKIILIWNFNSRWFLREFGSRLKSLLEEPNDAITRGLLKKFVIEAVANWERRAIVTDAFIVDTEVDKVHITITYQIISTKKEDTFTFPFYKTLIY